jgi:FAD/FMN-containing dehydrogenase
MPTAPSHFDGEFFTDLPTRAAYSEGAGPYRIVPRAVAVPKGLDDLRRLVDYAATHGQPLTPRGAGSGIPGNNVGPGIVVDMRDFTTPLAVSAEGVANVGAAISWGTLNAEAAHQGFRLGPNPSSGASCTIGGMVATNAAGARSVRAGSVRRWIRGVEMVTADGEIGWFARSTNRRTRRTPVPGQERSHNPLVTARMRFDKKVRPALIDASNEVAGRFPRTSKNSSGYAIDEYLKSGDLLDLIIGSEGTLGLVTRAALQLEPQPAAVASILLALGDIKALPDVLLTLLTLDPSAVELMDRSLLALAPRQAVPFALDGVEVVLLVDFEANQPQQAVETVAEARKALASRSLHFESAVTPEQRDALWALRHAASPTLANLPPNRRSLQIVEDGCVPVEKLDRYLAGIRAAGARLGVEVVIFGHAGNGHLHVNALADTSLPDFQGRLEALLEQVTNLVAELGGTPSGEHGDGRLRATLIERVYGPDIVELFESVKKAFDPPGIFNPGVILPRRGASGLRELKVGAAAHPIPAEIEQRLREVERTGGWGVPKTNLTNGSATG